MRGISVTLYDRVEVGRDRMNAPIFEEVPIQVDNVLIAPTSATEVLDTLNLTGKKAVYTLALPKGDSHTWEDRRVSFFNDNWRVISFPTEGLEHLIPLSWNKKVQVEKYG